MAALCLKDEERTSNNAEATISNRGTNRHLKCATRHFPELGILTKIMDAWQPLLRGEDGTFPVAI
jgi:hypothetical protein